MNSGGVSDATMLTEAWGLAKNAGLFASPLLLWLYLRADNERKKVQASLDLLLPRTLDTFNAGTDASKDMSRALASFMRGRNNAGATDV